LFLEDDSYALFNYVTTGNDGVTTAGVNLPGKHTNGGRFTGTVGAEQSEDFASPRVEADACYGLFAAKGAPQIVGFDHEFMVNHM
jgi:hypothetical protein